MQRIVLSALVAILFAPLVQAQKSSDEEFPKIEIFGGYSSIETSNHNFHFGASHAGFNVTDTDFDEGGKGFEAAITRNLNRYFGIMGDFSAHFSYDQGPVTLTPPCASPPCPTVIQTASINPRLYDFLAGPEFKWRNHTRLTPFAHALFGMAHTTATFRTAGPAVSLSKGDEDTGFAMAYGGGVAGPHSPQSRFPRVSRLRQSLCGFECFAAAEGKLSWILGWNCLSLSFAPGSCSSSPGRQP